MWFSVAAGGGAFSPVDMVGLCRAHKRAKQHAKTESVTSRLSVPVLKARRFPVLGAFKASSERSRTGSGAIPKLALNWLCFFAVLTGTNRHISLLELSLRSFGHLANWLFFSNKPMRILFISGFELHISDFPPTAGELALFFGAHEASIMP